MTRGKAVSESIQWTIIRLSATMPPHEISGYTDTSDRKIRDILAHFKKTGGVKVSKREKATLHKSLQDEDIQLLFNALDNTPDLYLDELRLELQERFGVSVSISTIWRTLKKGGYTMKKLSRIAIERSVEKRANFAARIGTYDANQLVFVDESAVDRRTTYRGYAWAIRGRKATRKAFFCRGKRYSVLPALSLEEGVLHCDIVEGSFDTASFYTFIERTLDHMQPFPAPNSVIVMDNCRIHKHPDIQNLIESRGMRFEFLPPYSPDYNPIELLFSAMKYRLRRNGDYIRFAMNELSEEDIHFTLTETVCDITQQDTFGWYRHCGYV